MKKVAVLGMGNLIRGDDAFGIIAARKLRAVMSGTDIDILENSGSGFDLINLISEYEKILIVDSMRVSSPQPGKIRRFTISPGEKRVSNNAFTLHQMGALTAIDIAKQLNMKYASEIVVYAVEADNIDEFTETVTTSVSEAVRNVVDMIKQELSG